LPHRSLANDLNPIADDVWLDAFRVVPPLAARNFRCDTERQAMGDIDRGVGPLLR
jgi:hypothetical protein